MARTLLVGAEIACPTSAGAATSFTQATVVRLVNNTGNAHKVTLLEEQSGAGIGSMTMPAGSVEYLEKKPNQVIFAANAGVLGANVGYTA
jgi:hypothetical protein|tara:strand:+ start:389 stop:658 length:270 start_codon:yes stop_codon:yes gene_type:complete